MVYIHTIQQLFVSFFHLLNMHIRVGRTFSVLQYILQLYDFYTSQLHNHSFKSILSSYIHILLILDNHRYNMYHLKLCFYLDGPFQQQTLLASFLIAPQISFLVLSVFEYFHVAGKSPTLAPLKPSLKKVQHLAGFIDVIVASNTPTLIATRWPSFPVKDPLATEFHLIALPCKLAIPRQHQYVCLHSLTRSFIKNNSKQFELKYAITPEISMSPIYREAQ